MGFHSRAQVPQLTLNVMTELCSAEFHAVLLVGTAAAVAVGVGAMVAVVVVVVVVVARVS